MDKNAIKKFAVWARTELIARVSLKGVEYGITENEIAPAAADSVGGKVLTDAEKKQRQALITEINDKGYKQVMEEVAYTWFNRFSALRFMEVNGYLPTRVRVFTDENNAFKPQILTEAIHMELDGLDMEKVYAYKEANDDDELYKYLLITQCNALNSVLPGMFQKIADYTELLFPDNLLREGSVVQQMIELIPEEDWKDAIQIIGWLYQYYNSEKKDDVFAALKKKVKITKENIPAATQLFTPDWIVRYMVENSLGRLWVEGHPNEELKSQWKYYLEEAEQEQEVQAQLAEIRKEYAALTPDQLKVIDPCSGSGHILAYMFDVLVQIYEAYGYTTREAVASIVENNIYGLDIDDRAAQLAYFAVMMKARQYDRRFFSRGIQPHVYAIEESNTVNRNHIQFLGQNLSDFERNEAHMQLEGMLAILTDAKEYGSILKMENYNWDLLRRYVDDSGEDGQVSMDSMGLKDTVAQLKQLIDISEVLAQKYDVVVTNPPYMGSSGMSAKLSNFVKKNYPDSKSDLFAVFIEKCGQMAKNNGYQAMITQHAWMFLSSFEKLRVKLLNMDIVNMAHLGARAFEEIGGEVVQTTSFVMRKSHIADYKGEYCRLIEPTTQQGKEDMFLDGENRYAADQSNFSKIPGSPVAYWVGKEFYRAFEDGVILEKLAHPKKGLATTDNNRFLRLWHEVSFDKVGIGFDNAKSASNSQKKWFPLNKGGEFRRWYGNKQFLVNWESDGVEMKAAIIKRYNGGSYTKEIRSEDKYFQDSITWSALTAGTSSFRYSDYGALFDSAGSSMFPFDKWKYILAILNTKVSNEILTVINPTLNYGAGSIANIPIIIIEEKKETIEKLSENNVKISHYDWDSFETSWDFQRHPLLQYAAFTPQMVAQEEANGYLTTNGIADAYRHWEQACDDRFNQLKANEEELNRIFIDIYGLHDELTPEIEEKDVTVRKADLGRDIRSFISYAVGCMFGRYSPYKDGLIFAGEPYSLKAWVEKINDKPGTISREELVRAYHNEGVVINDMFFPDEDNIIPISDDEYFEDDIVGLFVEFVKTVYGAETLDENLKFIADALGGKGQPKDVIRKYFMNDFYKDHCKIYQKRPIYWLFDSGKKNGFKALIYMHRYQPDTIARIRTDYVHEQQARYRTAIADLENRIATASTSERVKLNKKLKTLNDQAAEIHEYEEKIHHLADQMISIDLDDGVKKNYAIFQDVLAKIK